MSSTCLDQAPEAGSRTAMRADAVYPLPTPLRCDSRLEMDGLDLLGALESGVAGAAFFDPQYRGVLNRLRYGNEGKNRAKARCALPQMEETTIVAFIRELGRVLRPGGHLFLWMDKYHLCQGFVQWLGGTPLQVVDMVTWHKVRMGMGYRSRRTSEHLVVAQKTPLRARGVWTDRSIPDVWCEKISAPRNHPHQKPYGLQEALVRAVTREGDLVVDPAAGGFSILDVCRANRRRFLGCDIIVTAGDAEGKGDSA